MSFIGLPHKNAMVILFAGMYGLFQVPFPEMPTSGDLKSGDSISYTYSGFHGLQETKTSLPQWRRTLGIFRWGCAAGTLEVLPYTRATIVQLNFCYPILD